jgi:hypothetical protein
MSDVVWHVLIGAAVGGFVTILLAMLGHIRIATEDTRDEIRGLRAEFRAYRAARR